MKITVTGASGLVGSALVLALRADGHTVVRFVRRPAAAADEVSWDPAARTLAPDALAGVDAIVHLAGANIGDRRWTAGYRRQVRDSRVGGTTAISEAIARADSPPTVLLSASAVGYYGDTGDRAVDETAGRGSGFLADVVEQWENATGAAASAGTRVVLLRSGIVLSASGGALGKVLPLFRVGVGGRLGSGRQYVSWISLPDEVAAIRFLLATAGVAGPVNLTAPHPVTNADYTAAIARAVHRPAVVPVPGPALRLALGGFADEAVLSGQRVLPRVLERAGFAFSHQDIDAALAAVVGTRKARTAQTPEHPAR